MKKEYSVHKPEDFKEVISDIFTDAKEINPLVITLEGDLGAGKTTFTQELGKYIGVTEQITSPTFTIMKQYEVEYEKFNTLVHIDAYRIEDENEVGPLRLAETLNQEGNIVCIEWPEQITSVVLNTVTKIGISINKDESRTVTVESVSVK